MGNPPYLKDPWEKLIPPSVDSWPCFSFVSFVFFLASCNGVSSFAYSPKREDTWVLGKLEFAFDT